MDEHDVAENEVDDEVGGDDVKGKENDVDAEEEEDADVKEEDRSQDREAHFVRACAGDMRVEISKEPLRMDISRKNGRGHLVVLCELAQSKRTSIFHKNHSAWKFTGKMATDTSTDIVLCERVQSKWAWTFPWSHLVW